MAYKGIKIPEGATKAIKAGGVTIWQADTGGGLPIFDKSNYTVNESLLMKSAAYRATSMLASKTAIITTQLESGTAEGAILVNLETGEMLNISKIVKLATGNLQVYFSPADSGIVAGTLYTRIILVDSEGAISSNCVDMPALTLK